MLSEQNVDASGSGAPESAAAEGVTESIEYLKRTLTDEKQRADRFLSNWQRAQADLSNCQKRAEQEKCEAQEYGRSCLLLNLLPIIDDFDFAMASVPAGIAEDKWVAGIKMMHRKLMTFLEVQGVTPVEAKGRPFDPKYHEAVMHGEGEPDLVVQELRKGYMYKKAVLRPALVVVGRGEAGSHGQRPGKREKESGKTDSHGVEKGG